MAAFGSFYQNIQKSWVTELELLPQLPNVRRSDVIEAECGMGDGVLQVRTRTAMAGYLLRRRNAACTKDRSIKGGEYHLWLRNRHALYGVPNLMLAPNLGELSKGGRPH